MANQPRPRTARHQAALSISKVLRDGQSLAAVIPTDSQHLDSQDRGFYQELCFGTLRWFPKLNACLQHLLQTPLKSKDNDIQALLLSGLYQLLYTRVPDHAAISATVETTKALKKAWANKLVNGVLRNFQRQQHGLLDKIAQQPHLASAHPKWLYKIISQHWGDQAATVLDANNQHPPFTLRVNSRHSLRDDYLQRLTDANIAAAATSFSPVGITLEQACDVYSLPNFAEGHSSVQDEAAQLSATLLDLQPHQRVLDACCAPGGKTCHILEQQPELASVVAIDLEERRLPRVRENLARLNLHAEVICADAADTANWWDGTQFDRILLDAPCSATGVIRRHPDIKLLRKPDDIAKLAQLQLSLLLALWPTLAPGGRLVYATCSVIPTENTDVVAAFMQQQADAQHLPIAANWGIAQDYGRQLLPQTDGHDGFYYAVLEKTH